jgi:hypothetical protein
MLNNGWEFYILNPFDSEIEQKTQNIYTNMYSEAYNTFLNLLFIPEPLDLFKENSKKFMFVVNCEGDNDIIKLKSEYNYKFLKSWFFDKKIKKVNIDMRNYYKSHGITVRKIYKDGFKYFIDIELM